MKSPQVLRGFHLSEGITDGEGEGVAVLEGTGEVTATACVVGHVEGEAPVETEDEESHVVAQAEARADGDVLEELGWPEVHLVGPFVEIKQRFLIILIDIVGAYVVHIHIIHTVPYVAHIEEDGSMQVAEEGRTVFKVADNLQVTITHDIRHLSVQDALTVKPSRADGACAPGTDAVGTAGIEHLTVWGIVAVAVTPDDTRVQMGHQTGDGAQRPRLGEVGLQAYELGVGILEERLILLVETVATGEIPERDEVTSLLNGGLPADGVAMAGRTRIGVGVAHLGDEIVVHCGDEVGVGTHDGVEEFGGGVLELVTQREGRELMAAGL